MSTIGSPKTTATPEALRQQAARTRGRIIELSHHGDAAHLGSGMSCADIVTVLYGAILNVSPETVADENRDRFILSKGHAAMALYSTLEAYGFVDRSVLESFNQDGGTLAEHPGPHCAPGIEAATGSLGHGLPIAVGLALAAKISERPYRVFALLSDGECNEGSTWEAALFAPAQQLDNLVVIVDYNKWQATGRSNEVMALEPLAAKWAAFGWDAHELDGNDIPALLDRLKTIPSKTGKPTAIIAHTVKGKGIACMEDDNNWHYRIPTAEEVQEFHRELGLK